MFGLRKRVKALEGSLQELLDNIPEIQRARKIAADKAKLAREGNK